MGKLRNHGGDTVIGMVQWIGRKIRHHDPLSDVDNFVMTRGASQLRVGVVQDDPLKIVYLLKDGRRYEISVREIEASEPVPKLVAVGQ